MEPLSGFCLLPYIMLATLAYKHKTLVRFQRGFPITTDYVTEVREQR